MMTDPDFKQIFMDSWQMLRSGALSKAGLAARVDALAVQLSDAGAADSPQKRNFIRWGSLGSQTTGFQAFLPANLRNSSFPAGSSLAPGATLVLVSNAAAFPRRYGAGIAVSGDYGGQLDNTGDRLELAYPFGAQMLAFTWRDAWHTPTDGTGYSLVALDQNAPADGNLPASWAISPQLNSSPGIPASGYSLTFESWRHYHFTAAEQLQSGLAGPQDDPDGDSLVNLMEYALGTEPRTSTAGAAQPLPGLAAVGPDRFLTLTWSRPVRALDLTYTARFSPDLVTWSENSVMVGSPVPSTDGMETVRFRGTAKASPQVPGFSRLQVSKQ